MLSRLLIFSSRQMQLSVAFVFALQITPRSSFIRLLLFFFYLTFSSCLSFFLSFFPRFRNQTQLLLTAIRANARFPVSGTSFSFHCSRDKLLRKQRISTYAILCKDSRTLGNLIIRETWLTSLNNAASKEKGTRDNRQINLPARGIEDYLSNDA